MGFNPTELAFIDTETTGLYHWLGDVPFAVPMCDQDGEVQYFEWDVNPFTREVSPPEKELRFIQEILKGRTGRWRTRRTVYHNSKFDLRMLATQGLRNFAEVHDVFIAARICNTLEPAYGLKFLAKKYASFPDDDEKELQQIVNKARGRARKLGWKLANGARYGDKPAQADYWVPGMLAKLHPELAEPGWDEVLATYAIRDAWRTMALWRMYSEVLGLDDPDDADHPSLPNTYREEMKLWQVVWEMEGRGIAMDPDVNAVELSNGLKHKQGKLDFLRVMCKRPDFNPGSPQQLAEVLYGPKKSGGYELEPDHLTDSGNPSTDADALRVHGNHPFVAGVLSWRAAKKKVEFHEKYELFAVPDPLQPGGHGVCIHCQLNQAGAKTFRFSCTDPNFQQAADTTKSARSAEFINVRGPFGPRKGYRWYAMDYAQQEVYIYADCSQEENLLAFIAAGGDINTDIANKAWGGHGNPYALQAAAGTLELGNTTLSKKTASKDQLQILELWAEYGWNVEKARLGMTSTEALLIADKWLRKYEYNIVEAEKKIGQKRTRNKGKITMFTKIYGGGAKAIQPLMYCTLPEAKATMKQFDDTFPGINRYANDLGRLARQQGYIINKYDRRLNIDRDFAYRAVNYMVQSSAACMMKDSIVRCHEYLRRLKVDAHVLMTIHDELIFEIHESVASKPLLRGLKRIMEDNGGRIGVPMKVEVQRLSKRWDEKVDIHI